MFSKIELIPKKSIEAKEAEELFWMFLRALELNGQILKDYKLVKQENYVMYVTFPKLDSFDEKYDGKYVKQRRNEILEFYDFTVTPLGENLESVAYCQCKSRSAMEMITFSHDVDSMFVCCDCGKSVVLYELPFPDGCDEYYPMSVWQDCYSAMDILWLNSLCDRYTGNQRVNYQSLLNKGGIALAEEMSKKLCYPVYYHLQDDYGKRVKDVLVGEEYIHICPKCGEIMKRLNITQKDVIDVCEKCRLSYEAH